MNLSLPQSSTFKVLGIGFLALLMLIPLAQVQNLIRERSGMREIALHEIAQRWGAAQQIGAPMLAIPKRVRRHTANGIESSESAEILLADRAELHGTLVPEMRKYGIYEAPTYLAEIKIAGEFAGREVRALAAEAQRETQTDVIDVVYLFDRAEIRLPIGDVRGLRRISNLRIDAAELPFAPARGGARDEGLRTIAVPIDLSAWNEGAHKFALDLTIAGSASLQFLPLARRTEATLAAPWADPGFAGAYLPAERKLDAQGFSANWQVLDLNRSFGQRWNEGGQRPDIAGAAFGVNLYQPADLYQRNERAGKYGVLFIALTFVAFFLFEVLRKLRVHPVQYLLIGAALTVFYVVLLALSEQIGFGAAYLAAACAVVALVGGYASVVLRARRAGVLLGAVLALVYALLYGLIVSEQYSLLMGALALLATVAALMYLTRHVDWYAYGATASTKSATQ